MTWSGSLIPRSASATRCARARPATSLARRGPLARTGHQVVPLRDAQRPARGEFVLGARGVTVTEQVEQVRADGVHAVVAGQRGLLLGRVEPVEGFPGAVDHG